MLTEAKELQGLKVIFFLFGLSIMSWLPRFPEVKANLGLTNGEFGSLISLGSIGNAVSLLTVGHLVHKYGAKRMMQLAAAALAISIIALTQTSSTFIFLIFIILQGAGISAFHISINSQGFSYQDRTKKQVITLLSGYWSSGALITSAIAGLLVDLVSLQVHIFVVAIFSFVVMLRVIGTMTPNLVKPNENPESDFKLRDTFKGFNFDILISGGLLCAIMLEFAIGDWAAIFAKEDMGIVSGLHTLPYILFMLTMILGRLNFHRLLDRYTMEQMARVASVVSSLSFLLGIAAVTLLGHDNQLLTIIILSISFTFTGIGSSFLGPSMMNAANARSRFPASVVIGQIGIINICLVFVMRWIIAWTAQATSLSIALCIPATMLLAVPYFAKVFKSA
ncbi:ProP Permeases of the major facilitator superfamily [Candidatus Nanopelagicaceae bacterium]